LGRAICTGGLSDEGIEATRDFENMLAAWSIDHPQARPFESEKFIQEAGELILKSIDYETRQYTSQADTDEMRSKELESQ